MSKMQVFHNQLFAAENPPSPYWRYLRSLTQIGVPEMKAIKSRITWNIWG